MTLIFQAIGLSASRAAQRETHLKSNINDPAIFCRECDKMSILRELLAYFFSQKKFWLIPLIVVFAVIGLLLVASQGSVVAPLIYTLF
jgi:hypothetical protein